MPEILWKAYIDFEVDEQGDREKTRSLYERLVGVSGHHKVWISYAEFEGSSIPLPRAMREEEEDEDAEPRVVAGDAELARQVFERGYKDLKDKGLKAEVCGGSIFTAELKLNCFRHRGLLYLRLGRHLSKCTAARAM
jgi:crooked neck